MEHVRCCDDATDAVHCVKTGNKPFRYEGLVVHSKQGMDLCKRRLVQHTRSSKDIPCMYDFF